MPGRPANLDNRGQGPTVLAVGADRFVFFLPFFYYFLSYLVSFSGLDTD